MCIVVTQIMSFYMSSCGISYTILHDPSWSFYEVIHLSVTHFRVAPKKKKKKKKKKKRFAFWALVLNVRGLA